MLSHKWNVVPVVGLQQVHNIARRLRPSPLAPSGARALGRRLGRGGAGARAWRCLCASGCLWERRWNRRRSAGP